MIGLAMQFGMAGRVGIYARKLLKCFGDGLTGLKGWCDSRRHLLSSLMSLSSFRPFRPPPSNLNDYRDCDDSLMLRHSTKSKNSCRSVQFIVTREIRDLGYTWIVSKIHHCFAFRIRKQLVPISRCDTNNISNAQTKSFQTSQASTRVGHR